MPPRAPQRRPISRTKGSDPTVSIATASQARTNLNISEEQLPTKPQEQEKNDDLKKLIETLKNKLGGNTNVSPKKQTPPLPQAKATWSRSIAPKSEWKPAYTVLTRISNHEKVPLKANKQAELTINSVPHSFLYRPGIDGIKIDKLSIKAGKQVGIG